MAARYRHLPLGGSLAADFTPRPDGTTLVLSSEPLRDYPKRLTDRLIHWAETQPGHTLVAKRERGGQCEASGLAQREAPPRPCAHPPRGSPGASGRPPWARAG